MLLAICWSTFKFYRQSIIVVDNMLVLFQGLQTVYHCYWQYVGPLARFTDSLSLLLTICWSSCKVYRQFIIVIDNMLVLLQGLHTVYHCYWQYVGLVSGFTDSLLLLLTICWSCFKVYRQFIIVIDNMLVLFQGLRTVYQFIIYRQFIIVIDNMLVLFQCLQTVYHCYWQYVGLVSRFTDSLSLLLTICWSCFKVYRQFIIVIDNMLVLFQGLQTVYHCYWQHVGLVSRFTDSLSLLLTICWSCFKVYRQFIIVIDNMLVLFQGLQTVYHCYWQYVGLVSRLTDSLSLLLTTCWSCFKVYRQFIIVIDHMLVLFQGLQTVYHCYWQYVGLVSRFTDSLSLLLTICWSCFKVYKQFIIVIDNMLVLFQGLQTVYHCYWPYVGIVSRFTDSLSLLLTICWSCFKVYKQFIIVIDNMLVLFQGLQTVYHCYWQYVGLVSRFTYSLSLVIDNMLVLFQGLQTVYHCYWQYVGLVSRFTEQFIIVIDNMLVLFQGLQTFCHCYWQYVGLVSRFTDSLSLLLTICWSCFKVYKQFIIVIGNMLVLFQGLQTVYHCYWHTGLHTIYWQYVGLVSRFTDSSSLLLTICWSCFKVYKQFIIAWQYVGLVSRFTDSLSLLLTICWSCFKVYRQFIIVIDNMLVLFQQFIIVYNMLVLLQGLSLLLTICWSCFKVYRQFIIVIDNMLVLFQGLQTVYHCYWQYVGLVSRFTDSLSLLLTICWSCFKVYRQFIIVIDNMLVLFQGLQTVYHCYWQYIDLVSRFTDSFSLLLTICWSLSLFWQGLQTVYHCYWQYVGLVSRFTDSLSLLLTICWYWLQGLQTVYHCYWQYVGLGSRFTDSLSLLLVCWSCFYRQFIIVIDNISLVSRFTDSFIVVDNMLVLFQVYHCYWQYVGLVSRFTDNLSLLLTICWSCFKVYRQFIIAWQYVGLVSRFTDNLSLLLTICWSCFKVYGQFIIVIGNMLVFFQVLQTVFIVIDNMLVLFQGLQTVYHCYWQYVGLVSRFTDSLSLLLTICWSSCKVYIQSCFKVLFQGLQTVYHCYWQYVGLVSRFTDSLSLLLTICWSCFKVYTIYSLSLLIWQYVGIGLLSRFTDSLSLLLTICWSCFKVYRQFIIVIDNMLVLFQDLQQFIIVIDNMLVLFHTDSLSLLLTICWSCFKVYRQFIIVIEYIGLVSRFIDSCYWQYVCFKVYRQSYHCCWQYVGLVSRFTDSLSLLLTICWSCFKVYRQFIIVIDNMLVLFQGLHCLTLCWSCFKVYRQLSLLLTICWSCFKVYGQFIIGNMLVFFQGYWQYVGLVSRFTDSLSLLLTICWSCFKVYRQFIIVIDNMLVLFQGLQTVYHCYWQYVGLVSRFTDSLSLLLTICWSCFKVYRQFIIVIDRYHCWSCFKADSLQVVLVSSLSLLLTICWSCFKVYRQFIIVIDNMLVLFQGLQTVYHCYWQYVGLVSRFTDSLSLLLTICWSCFKVYRQFIIVIDNMLVLFQGLQTVYHCYWQYVGLVSRFTDSLSLLLTICWSCFKVYRQCIIVIDNMLVLFQGLQTVYHCYWQYISLVSRFTDSLSLLLAICWSSFKWSLIVVIDNMLVLFQGLQTVYHCYWQYVGLVSRFTDSLSLLLTICWSCFKVYRQFIIVIDNMLVLFQGLQTVYHCYWQYVGLVSRFTDSLSLLLTICWSCFKVYRQFIIVIDNMLVLFQGLQTVYHCYWQYVGLVSRFTDSLSLLLTICWSCFKVYRQFIIVIDNMLVLFQGLQTIYHCYWQYVGLVSRFTDSLSLLLTICWSCFKVYRQFIIAIDNMLVLFQGLQFIIVSLVSTFTLLLTICWSCFKVYRQFIIVIDNMLVLFQGLQTIYHCYWQYVGLVSRFTDNLSLLLTICWSCFKVYRQFIIVIDNMLVLFQGLQTVYHCYWQHVGLVSRFTDSLSLLLTICWSCFKVYRQFIIVIDNMLVLFQGLQTVYHCYWQYVGLVSRFTDSLSLLLTIVGLVSRFTDRLSLLLTICWSCFKVYRQFIIVIDNMLVLFQGLQTVYHCYWQYVGLVSRFTDSLSLLLTICWSCFKVYRQFIIVIDNMLVLFQGLQTVYHCYWQYVGLVSRFTDSLSLLLTICWSFLGLQTVYHCYWQYVGLVSRFTDSLSLLLTICWSCFKVYRQFIIVIDNMLVLFQGLQTVYHCYWQYVGLVSRFTDSLSLLLTICWSCFKVYRQFIIVIDNMLLSCFKVYRQFIIVTDNMLVLFQGLQTVYHCYWQYVGLVSRFTDSLSLLLTICWSCFKVYRQFIIVIDNMLVLFQGLQTIYHCYWQYVGLVSRFTDNLSLLLTICWSCFKVYRQFIIAWQYVGLVSRFTDSLSLLLTICWSCFKVYRQFIIVIDNMLVLLQGLQTVYHCYWQYVGPLARFTDSLSLLLTICWSSCKIYRQFIIVIDNMLVLFQGLQVIDNMLVLFQGLQFIIVIDNMLVLFQGLQTVYHCYWQYVGLVSRFTDSLSLLLTICWSCFKVYRQFIIVIDNMLSCFKVYRQSIIVVDNMLVLFQGLQTIYHCYWQYVGLVSRFTDSLSLLLTICWSCFKVYRQFIIVIDNMLVLFQGLQTVYHCYWQYVGLVSKVYRQFIIVIDNILVLFQGLVSRFTDSLSLLLTICWSCFKVYRQFIIVIDNMLVLFQGLQTVYHCLTICWSCFKVYRQSIIVNDNMLVLFQGLRTVYHCYWQYVGLLSSFTDSYHCCWQYVGLVSRFTDSLSLLLTICWSSFKVYRQFIIVIDNMLVLLFQQFIIVLTDTYSLSLLLTICWSCFKVYRQFIIVIDNMLVLFQGLQTVYHCYWQYVGLVSRFTDSLSLLLTICWSCFKVYRQFIIVIGNMLVFFQGLQTVYHCYWQYVGLVSRFTDSLSLLLTTCWSCFKVYNSLSLLLTICWSCFKVYRQFIIVIDNMLVLFQGLQTVYHCYWQYVGLVSRFTDSLSLLLTIY